MDNDDQMVGRVLSRREALKLLTAASAAMLAGCGPATGSTTEPTAGQAATDITPEPETVVATLEAAGPNEESATALATEVVAAAPDATTEGATVVAGSTPLPSCIVSPELTEGPYFVDEQLNRSDIRVDSTTGEAREGAPLQLAMRVSNVSTDGCAALEDAMVDIWHCDALGVYSGVSDRSQGFDTRGENFLRGYQLTDASGAARFTTIYPGWYAGRAVHIHFKVRTDAANGQSYEFTSQLFFEPATWAQIYTQEPYASKGAQPDTPNESDGIYQNGGDQLTLALTESADGYAAILDIGLDLSDTGVGAADGVGPGGPPPPNT